MGTNSVTYTITKTSSGKLIELKKIFKGNSVLHFPVNVFFFTQIFAGSGWTLILLIFLDLMEQMNRQPMVGLAPEIRSQ